MATLHERQLLRGTAAIAAVAGTSAFPVGCRTGGEPVRVWYTLDVTISWR